MTKINNCSCVCPPYESKNSECSIAVLLPCFNEEMTIAKTVTDFHTVLPEAKIYVFNNASTDNSAQLAREAGAIVVNVNRRGKGNVVRAMFRDIEADVYVMADADDTYPANEVKELIRPIVMKEADMVTGDRLSSTYFIENKRKGHNFGNTLVCWLIRLLWKCDVKDVMTGYRAFSRRFVKTCPVLSEGFEIETEITMHAFDKRMQIKEVPITYRDRPSGSVSKLHTIRDGIRVLLTIFNTFRLFRPLHFFGIIGLFLLFVGTCFSIPVFTEYFQTGLVPRVPTFIFAVFLSLAGLVSCAVSLILDSVKKQADREFELMLMATFEPLHSTESSRFQ